MRKKENQIKWIQQKEKKRYIAAVLFRFQATFKLLKVIILCICVCIYGFIQIYIYVFICFCFLCLCLCLYLNLRNCECWCRYFCLFDCGFWCSIKLHILSRKKHQYSRNPTWLILAEKKNQHSYIVGICEWFSMDVCVSVCLSLCLWYSFCYCGCQLMSLPP